MTPIQFPSIQPKKSPFFTRLRAPDTYASRWIKHKVDASYDAYPRQIRRLKVLFTIQMHAFLSSMASYSFEEWIPIFSARYSGDHV